jgi:hypothetical protein
MEKLPFPVPLGMKSSSMVGSGLSVLQQTPLSVTCAPPSLATVPPQTAEFKPISVTSEVIIRGFVTTSSLHPKKRMPIKPIVSPKTGFTIIILFISKNIKGKQILQCKIIQSL